MYLKLIAKPVSNQQTMTNNKAEKLRDQNAIIASLGDVCVKTLAQFFIMKINFACKIFYLGFLQKYNCSNKLRL